ncbi:hypothetical protein GCM10009779_17970 [Polymorphospora rubra]
MTVVFPAPVAPARERDHNQIVDRTCPVIADIAAYGDRRSVPQRVPTHGKPVVLQPRTTATGRV